jgi:membrane fusion protein, multidrug efflux system
MNKRILSLLAMVSIILTLNACGGKKKDLKTQIDELKTQKIALEGEIARMEKEFAKTDTSRKKDKTFFVAVVAAEAKPFNHFIELQGGVVADDEVFVTSRVMGSITKVNIQVGDKVQAGQVIAEVDDAMLNQQMAELQNRLDFAQDLYNKQKSLWDQKIGSEVQYLTAKNGVEAIIRSMATLREGQSMYKILAPISGIADEVSVKIGQAAMPGSPLAKLVNFNKLKVKAEVAEAYAGKVKQGNTVTVGFPDLKKEVQSKVSYIGNSVNPLTRTFKVEVNMKGNEAGLIPNMVSIIKVADYSSVAVVVPINLIQKDLEGDFIYLMDEASSKAKKARVVVGTLYGDQAEIKSGINKGDKIIVTGYQEINEGDTVKL